MTDRALEISLEQANSLIQQLIAEEEKERNSKRTTFAYNPKSLRRSLMMKPPTINFETEKCKQKTKAVSLDNYEGQWKFKAYFPRNCKQEPTCRIDRITFKR